MDEALKFTYTRLKTHVAEAKGFEVAARNVNAKVAKYKKDNPR